MRILFCGDVVGRAGRDLVLERVAPLRERLRLDFVIVNVENAAHGFGVTGKQCDAFFQAGVDVATLGNHSWDQREIISYIDGEPRLVRPLNYPSGTPGRGFGLFRDGRGRKILVAQLLGRLFMEPMDDPFAAVAQLLERYPLGGAAQAIIIDMHAEATSEKMAMGHFLDGKVSAVLGSHSHVPTADAQILTGGTAYMTDAGMCGDYNSVIGMKKEAALFRFTRRIPGDRLSPAEGPGTLCGAIVETDDATGRAVRIEPLRLEGRLQATHDLK